VVAYGRAMPRVIALAALLVALSAAPATAQPATIDDLANRAPATRVYGDALLREALVVADRYWRRLGVDAPCEPVVYVYDGEQGAVGEIGGCAVAFARDFRNATWGEYTNRELSLPDRRRSLRRLCALAAHERGHNLGLQHSDTGVMSLTARVVPTECRQWAVRAASRGRKAPR
jgi:hypothetical protein